MMGVDAALCAVGMGEQLKQLVCKKVSGWSLNVGKAQEFSNSPSGAPEVPDLEGCVDGDA